MSAALAISSIAVLISAAGVIHSWIHGGGTRNIAEKAAGAAERSAEASERSAKASEANAELAQSSETRAIDALRPRLRITKAVCVPEGNAAQRAIQATFENYGRGNADSVVFRAVIVANGRYAQMDRLTRMTPDECCDLTLRVPVGAVLKEPKSFAVEVVFTDAFGPREEAIPFDHLEYRDGPWADAW